MNINMNLRNPININIEYDDIIYLYIGSYYIII